MKKIIKDIMATALAAVFIVNFSILEVHAEPLDPHAYAQSDNQAVYYGCSFHNPYGQTDLDSDYWNQHDRVFITNEMWVAFNSGAQWIEAGDVDGSVNGNYWAGNFCARRLSDSDYKEYTIGSQYAGTNNTFQVSKTSGQTFAVQVNGGTYFSFTMASGTISYMRCGVETNTTLSHFSNGMYVDQLKYIDSNNNWVNCTNMTNRDHNSLGWKSTYSQSSNRLTYTN